MDLKPNMPIIFITLSTVTICSLGTSTIGSFTGDIVYLVSVLFLISFVIVNIFNRQKIEKLSGNESKSGFINVAYLSALPLIYLCESFNRPSIYLICLFFLFFILTLTWSIFINGRKITNLTILLFILCFMPLIYGIYISSNYESQINKDILFLEERGKYYNDNFDYIILGCESKGFTPYEKNIMEYKIKKLNENVYRVKELYQKADYNKCNEEIIKFKIEIKEIDNFFMWVDPDKKISEELHNADKGLIYRYEQYSQLMRDSLDGNKNEELIFDLAIIGDDINRIGKKLDDSWSFYKKEQLNKSYKSIIEVKAEFYGDFCQVDEKIEIVKIKLAIKYDKQI